MTTSSGRLRHRVTIQRATETADAAGQPIPSWTDLATVWGDYQSSTGVEISPGEQVRSVVNGSVTIRRYDGITPKDRLKVNGWGVTDLILGIDAVQPPDPGTGMQTLLVSQPEAGQVL